jgi:chromosome segregation ATPase
VFEGYVNLRVIQLGYGYHNSDLDLKPGEVVLETFDQDVAEPTSREEADQYGSLRSLQTGAVVVRRRSALVGFKRDERLETMCNDIAVARNERATLTTQLDAVQKQLAAKTAELMRLDVDMDTREKGRVQLNQLLGAEQTKSRKLEADIAKIRAAVGAIRMKEILGEKTS